MGTESTNRRMLHKMTSDNRLARTDIELFIDGLRSSWHLALLFGCRCWIVMVLMEVGPVGSFLVSETILQYDSSRNQDPSVRAIRASEWLYFYRELAMSKGAARQLSAEIGSPS